MLVKDVVPLENSCCSHFHPRQSAEEIGEGFSVVSPDRVGISAPQL
jgi:hypothetical protein